MKSRAMWVFSQLILLSSAAACVGSPSADVASGAQDANASGGDGDSVGSATDDGNVKLTGTVFAQADGKEVSAKWLAAGGAVAGSANGRVSSGGFSLALGAKNAQAAGGNVVLFVDLNGDGVCNIAPTDVGAQMPLPAGGSLSAALDANAQAPCAAFGDFSFEVKGNDFTPHNNKTLYAALMDVSSKAFVTEAKGSKVVGGVWSVTFPGALVKGRSYQLRYFADLAASGKCQNHSWTSAIAAASKDTTLTVSHDTAQTPVCDNFPPL